MRLFFLLIFCQLLSASYAQDLNRVREYLDTLCAPGMHGRGYIQHGDKIAATYIENQFKVQGLQFFGTSSQEEHPYFQYFKFDINTFPSVVSLKTDSRTLSLGVDYILSPDCGSGKGTYKLKFLDTAIFTKEDIQKKFLKLNTKKLVIAYPQKCEKLIQNLPENVQQKLRESVCVLKLIDKKLTASLSSRMSEIPEFEVLEKSLPKSTKKISFEVEAVMKKNYESQNVIGYFKGSEYPDSFIVISAHYDHLGRMGKIYFPGANDNASGISVLLELVNHFKINKSKYSIVFMAFGAEEAGLIGSAWFTNNPLFSLKKVRFLINLDLLGTGSEGITVVNGSTHKKEFDMLSSINNENGLLPQIKKRGPAANSDHYFFELKGVPTFFIYTMGGISAYHDIYDRKETLPLDKFKEVFNLLIKFIDKL